MAKDDSGGFLSKVVKFVRHPTTSWADLDTREVDRESEYSKAALKEMIERKRRNDFVRKREFDMLRKIRSREGTPGEAQGVRPSFFQSSLPSRPDDRAMTLKKIDEIEAQMSMQWWKTKGPDSAVSTGGAPGASMQDRLTSQQRADLPTEPAGLQSPRVTSRPLPRMETQPATTVPMALTGATPTAPDKLQGASVKTGLVMPVGDGGAPSAQGSSFSASRFYALEVQEVAQDPEVEEAAIRFANGDDAGAEQGLMDMIIDGSPKADDMASWLTIFDFYRATGQVAPYESRAVDFTTRFHRSPPQWYDMPGAVAAMSGKEASDVASANVRAHWVSEVELDAYSVGTLQNVLQRAASPWVIDWSPLRSLDQKAARALLGIFTLWGDQPVELRFIGAHALRDCLRDMTPAGRRDVEQLWWELRMAALRVMNRADEFELTALDFCVTYEVSPPGWERPRCRFQQQQGEPGSPDVDQSVLGESVLEPLNSTLSGESSTLGNTLAGGGQLGMVELSGEVRGDPQATLDALEDRLAGADVLIISCRNLIRVDFSAAGTLLNWVSRHHAEGRLVQFVDVHRLVSAFFHVIGITEYAKVVLRTD
ncbi:STAS domain-containing protein [Hydrogenophaga sp. R2]|uniref:STAS domain-containing protein n=1 Tax=Hydrogenophaga sp. R2 TaxID=3132827 RepID=UPI003CF56155